MTTKSKLLKDQKRLIKKIKDFENLIKGSICTLYQTCGTKGCKCEKGEKHPGTYISMQHNNKSKTSYVPRSEEERMSEWSKAYKKHEDLISELTLINLELLKHRKK